MNDVLTPILARLVRGEDVAGRRGRRGLGEILEGRVTDVQAAGFIVALRAKGETAAELAALVRTMHGYSGTRSTSRPARSTPAGRAATARAPSTSRRWPR